MHTSYFRDTWVEVDLDKLIKNISSIQEILPDDMKIFAVVKANAYGHGDIHIAKTALKAGAHGLAVAFLDEALHLRNNGIQAPILVLGASRPSDAKVAAKNQISLTVFQLEWLKEAFEILNEEEALSLHVKCDTGMGRIGVREIKELKDIEEYIHGKHCFSLNGIFTHFATADEINTDYYELQLKKFSEMVSSLKERPSYVHSANSASSLRFNQSEFNAVRYGIAMYGLSPSEEIKTLLPFELNEVFSLHSRLIHVKKVPKGTHISYGATYEAEEDEWIGTLPIGYADGWIRKLQEQEVIVEGKRAPIVGRICMDQCMIKLPHYVRVGTKVTLIGSQEGETISIDEIAEKLDTINYEIPCMISTRIPRVYLQNGETKDVVNYLL